MTHKQIYDLLLTLGTQAKPVPVAYNTFISNKGINPPFIVYRETGVDTFKADSKTYYRPRNFEIELVTEVKDVDLQDKLEKLLNDNNIPFDTTDEVWDEEERIYHNFYEI